MKKGIFCISIDLELLWGRKDLVSLNYFKARISRERKVINQLLYLFKKYNIPATWAAVGKIFEQGNSNYSGLDIIEKINKVDNQEIASHSYTHPDFTQISRNEAQDEFDNFITKSFVFPKNKIKYLDELKKSGFKAYRGKDNNPYELLIPRTPPVCTPINTNGVLNILGSMYLVSGRGLKRFIPENLRYIKCKLGIINAIRQNKIFHIWFHPIDFVDDSKKIFSDFEKILKYASKQRDQYKLDILNMNQITDKLTK